MARARNQGKVTLAGLARRSRSSLMVSTALQAVVVMVLAVPAGAQPAPNARPTGGVVTGGVASITQSPTNTTITQSTQRGAVNWQSFDVGSNQSVTFQQPNAQAITLNTVTGPNPSQIAGRIDANGQVVLVNQSGVTVYKGSQVNTAGLMVSAAGTDTKAFMAGGPIAFNQPGSPDARIVNNGNISIKDAGLAALVAPSVANAGTISARLGHVVLAGGTAATLDLYGDKLVSVDVTGSVTRAPGGGEALVTNTGLIRANGGTVQLTAKAVDGVVSNLVSAGGKIVANTVGSNTGRITIDGVGGSITIDGDISAVGKAAGTTGGQIRLLADEAVIVKSGATVNASGAAGGGTIAVGTTLKRATGGPSVTNPKMARGVLVQQGATIKADATGSGDGGRITVLSSDLTVMQGTLSAQGGTTGGNGGFIEVSGGVVSLTGAVLLGAPNGAAGSLLLDPQDLTILDKESTNGPNNQSNSDVFSQFTNTGSLTGLSGPTNGQSYLTADEINQIGTSGVSGHGAGVNVTLVASGTIEFQNTTTAISITSDLTASAGRDLLVDPSVNLTTTTNMALTGGRLLSIGGTVQGASVTLSGSAVAIPGSITTGGTTSGLVSLTATNSSGTIAGAGSITAGTLTATSPGAITLNGSNAIGTIGAISGNGVRINDGVAVTIAAGSTVNAGTGNATVTVGDLLTINGAVTGAAVSLSGTGIAFGANGFVTDGGTGSVNLTATSAGITQNSGTIVAVTLTGSAVTGATLAGNATGVTGTGATNQIGTLGGFTVSAGDLSLINAGGTAALKVLGTVSANNIALSDTGTGGVAVGNGGTRTTLQAQGVFPSGTVSVLADKFTVAATRAAITGSLFEYAPVTAGTLTVGSSQLADLTGVATSGVRLGRARGTTTATGIDATATLDLGVGNGGAPRSLDLVASGGASGVLTNVSVLTGTLGSGGLTLTSPGVNIGTIGAFSTGGTIAVVDTVDLAISGAVSASSVSLTAPNIVMVSPGSISTVSTAAPGSITLVATAGSIDALHGALLTGTLSGSATGLIPANGSIVATNTANAFGTIAGLTATGALSVVDSQALALTGTIGGTSVDLSTTAGAITQGASGVLNAGTLLSSSGVAAGMTLAGTANSIQALGSLAITNDLSLTNALGAGTLLVQPGITAANVVLREIGAGGIAISDGVTATTVAATNTLSVRADALSVPGTGTLTAAVVELAPDTVGGNLTPSIPAGVTATSLVRLGSANGTVTAGTITLGADLTLNSGGAAIPLDLRASGNITDTAGGFAVKNVSTLTAVTTGGSVSLTNANNTIAAVGSVSANQGFTLTTSNSMSIAAQVSAASVVLNAPTITSTGTILTPGTTGLVSLTTGAGAIDSSAGVISTGTLIGYATGDILLNAAGNQIGTITSLNSTGGSIVVNGGSVLTIAGPVLATTVGKSVGLTTTGLLTVASGQRVDTGSASLNGGSIVIAGTVGDTALSSAVTLTATGTGTAATIDASTGTINAFVLSGSAAGAINVTGLSNTITNLATLSGASVAVNSGVNMDLLNTVTAAGSVALSAPLLSMSLGSTITTPGTGSVSLTSGGSIVAANGVINTGTLSGSATDVVTLTNAGNAIGTISGLSAVGTLAVVNSTSLVLAGSVGAGATGTVDITTTGAASDLTQAAAGVLTAGKLTSTGGIGGAVSLLGTANAIGTLTSFAVAGSGLAITNGNGATGLTVIGPLSAKNIWLRDIGTGGVIVGDGVAATTIAATSGTVSVRADHLTINALGSVTGAVAELASDSTGTAQTLGAGVFATSGVTGTSLLRLGSAHGTITAGSISVPVAGYAASNLELDATGTIDQAGILTVSTLAGSAATFALNGFNNLIGTIGGTGLFGTGTLATPGTIAILNGQGLTIASTVSAAVVSLSAPSITMVSPGSITSGGSATGSVSLTASAGSITGGPGLVTTGSLTAIATGGSIDLSNVGNRIGTLGSITGTGVSINDGVALAVASGATVSGGTGNVTLATTDTLTINGTVTAASVGLSGAGVTIAATGLVADGGVAPDQVALKATSGGILDSGTILAVSLTGSAVTGASILGAGTVSANQIGTLGPFKVTGGDLSVSDQVPTLTVAGSVTANNILLVNSGVGGVVVGNGVTATTLSASNAGTVSVKADAFSVDTLVLPVGTVTGGAFELAPYTPGGALNITNGLAGVGTPVISLGSIVGTIIANSITLTSLNNPGDLILNAIGTVTQALGSSLTVGTLSGTAASFLLPSSVNAIGTIGGTPGLVATGTGVVAGTIAIADSTTMAVTGLVSAGTNGVVDLTTGAGGLSITQPAASTLIAGTLLSSGGISGSAVFAGTNNQILSLGSIAVSGGSLVVNSGTALTVAGNLSASGNVSLTSAGLLTINSGQSVSGSAVALQGGTIAIPGTVTTGGAGVGSVTLTATGAGGTISDAGGAITTGTITGSAATGAISLIGANLIGNIGSLSGVGVQVADGVTTTIVAGAVVDGGTSLADVASNGLLFINGTLTGATIFATGVVAIDFGAAGLVNAVGGGSRLVDLISTSGGIAENGLGTIIAGTMTGQAFGGAVLSGVSAGTNQILNLGSFSSPGGTIGVVSGTPMSVTGPVSTGGSVGLASTQGLTIASGQSVSGSGISLTGGAVTVLGTVTTGGSVSGAVTMNATAAGALGTIDTAQGFVQTGTLSGSANGAVTVTNTVNAIGTLGALSGTGVTVNDGVPLTVGAGTTVNAGTGAALLTTTGGLSVVGTVTGAAVALTGTTGIGFGSSGVASASGSLALTSTGGAISEASGSGTIIAGTLTAAANGAVTLAGASASANQIRNLGAVSGSSVVVNSGTTMAVRALVSAPTVTLSASSLTIPGTVSTGGSLTGTVSLAATGVGGVIDASGGLIQTGALSGSALGTITLPNPSNAIGAIGPLSGTGIFLNDGAPLTVTANTAVNAGGGTAALSASGTLTINGTVTGAAIGLSGVAGITFGPSGLVTTPGTVTLTSSAGAINEALGSGTIIANTVAGSSAGGLTLLGAPGANLINNLGTFVATTGPIGLADQTSLTINNIWSANAGVTLTSSGTLSIAAGGGVTGTAVALSGSQISILGSVSTGGASLGSLSLTSTGVISETAGGVILTGSLTGSAGGAITLANTANAIGAVGPLSGVGITLNDGNPLTVTAGTNVNAQTGLASLTSGGSLTVNGTVSGAAVTLTGTSGRPGVGRHVRGGDADLRHRRDHGGRGLWHDRRRHAERFGRERRDTGWRRVEPDSVSGSAQRVGRRHRGVRSAERAGDRWRCVGVGRGDLVDRVVADGRKRAWCHGHGGIADGCRDRDPGHGQFRRIWRGIGDADGERAGRVGLHRRDGRCDPHGIADRTGDRGHHAAQHGERNRRDRSAERRRHHDQ